jgi:hypothetical protein
VDFSELKEEENAPSLEFEKYTQAILKFVFNYSNSDNLFRNETQ